MLRRLCVAFVVLLAIPGVVISADGPSLQRRVDDHLAAGEFGPALRLAEQGPSVQQGTLLGRVAIAQAEAGAFNASLATAARIRDDQSRGSALQAITSQPLAARGGTRSPAGSRGGAGGAALADFDSIIDLITTTIEPTTWDTVGGPGAIDSFPNGVYVDPSGTLKRLVVAGPSELKELRSESVGRHSPTRIRSESGLRKVSLTRLERHLQALDYAGGKPDESMLNLAGLHDIRYVFVYPETGEVVLAGPAGDWSADSEGRTVHRETGRPVLQLDDLVTVFRTVLRGDGTFGCTIDPRQENLREVQQFLNESSSKPLKPSARGRWLDELRAKLGYQDIRFFGIDGSTRAAWVLVEADYHMKLVGMGLEKGTVDVPSYLDSLTLEGGAPPAMDVLRWWFNVSYEAVRTTADRDAFELVGSGVRVSSENQLVTKDGERVRTGKSKDRNQQFASRFTRHYDDLAQKYHHYADLRNIFDLALVAALVQSQDVLSRTRTEFQYLLGDAERSYEVEHRAVPKRVESVINHRLLGRKHLVVGVSGGVLVDTSLLMRPDLLQSDEGQLTGSLQSSTPPAQANQWWWD